MEGSRSLRILVAIFRASGSVRETGRSQSSIGLNWVTLTDVKGRAERIDQFFLLQIIRPFFENFTPRDSRDEQERMDMGGKWEVMFLAYIPDATIATESI